MVAFERIPSVWTSSSLTIVCSSIHRIPPQREHHLQLRSRPATSTAIQLRKSSPPSHLGPQDLYRDKATEKRMKPDAAERSREDSRATSIERRSIGHGGTSQTRRKSKEYPYKKIVRKRAMSVSPRAHEDSITNRGGRTNIGLPMAVAASTSCPSEEE